MQELINRLTEKAGISTEQAGKAIDTIREFVKEKFPMVAGAMDNVFKEPAGKPATAGGSNFMDKISDVIPGQAGEKVETFAKQAAEKAEDLFDDAKEKLGGLFHAKK